MKRCRRSPAVAKVSRNRPGQWVRTRGPEGTEFSDPGESRESALATAGLGLSTRTLSDPETSARTLKYHRYDFIRLGGGSSQNCPVIPPYQRGVSLR